MSEKYINVTHVPACMGCNEEGLSDIMNGTLQGIMDSPDPRQAVADVLDILVNYEPPEDIPGERIEVGCTDMACVSTTALCGEVRQADWPTVAAIYGLDPNRRKRTWG